MKKAKESRRGKSPEAIALLDNAMTELNNRLYTIEERLVQYRARANQDLIANPTGIDSKLAQLLGLRVDGRRPAHRRIEGPAEAHDRRHRRALACRCGGEEGNGGADEAGDDDREIASRGAGLTTGQR